MESGLFPALFISMIASAALGVTIEFLAYRPLRNSTRISALITAIGVSYLLQNVMIFSFHQMSDHFHKPLPAKLIVLVLWR